MPKRIFIGGLSAQTTQEEVRKAFSQIGEVVAVSIYSGGTAEVDMAGDELAQLAIRQLNRKKLNGDIITVSESATRDNQRSKSGE